MTSPTQPREQTLIDTIRQRIAQAARAPGLAARHEAIFDVVPALKAQIDETRAHDPLAASEASACLREAFESFQRVHAIARLPYAPRLDARYPYRDESLNPVLIAELRDPAQKSAGDTASRIDAVMPYVDPASSDESRGAAYRNTVHCRLIEPADLRDPREHVLVGERGAFAARHIKRGECVGVYGGRLMSAAMFFTCANESFVISASSGNSIAFIDGENVLAMANTSLAYDARGMPVGQAHDGYNLEAASFDAGSRCGRRFSIRALFAMHDIEQGAELRWNYRYSAQLVQHVFGEAYRPQ